MDGWRSSRVPDEASAVSTRSMLASEGAKVVVNDLGADSTGAGSDPGPAHEVVAEIEAMGGEAVVNGADVTDFAEAGAMVAQAVDAFGDSTSWSTTPASCGTE